MKYFTLFLILCATVVLLASSARAASWEDPWAFLYEFPLVWQDNDVVQVESYRMTTGDAPALTPGAWTLSILSESGERLQRYSFDPASMAVGGKFSLIVPIAYRGAQARVFDPLGKVVLTIGLRESRICNDNGVCQADAGEVSENCPTDCARVSALANDAVLQTATLTQQASLGERAGGILLRLSSGIAGLLLLIGIARMLDNRRRT